MDLETSSVGFANATVQFALAAKFAKMNSDQSKNIVKLLDAGEASLASALQDGVGTNLDITA